MKEEILSNDLQEMLTQAIKEMKAEAGENFCIEKINLAELERRTHLSRGKLRRLKKNGFRILPNGNRGKRTGSTVLRDYAGMADSLLEKSVTNSEVIFERLKGIGYSGSLSSVKRYISTHRELVPAKRETVSPQGNRGRRYHTGPGEAYQMDWGFVNVQSSGGIQYRCACFAMICHHCGQRYVEFFPNAKQENLFIGMIHAFIYMGVPDHVLTDNMKSVTLGRDEEGKPIWQKDYESFMKTIGFQTKLCKPRHPFTKGAVERLVRFVKDNFIVGRVFGNVTDLNIEAFNWCSDQNSRYHKAVDCIPNEVHQKECLASAKTLTMTREAWYYICPVRKISFDGFVNYEGRRFGVPYSYTQKTCRIRRDGFYIFIYDTDLTVRLSQHEVTWSRKDSFCADQYIAKQPEELPTSPVTALLQQKEESMPANGFDKFNFMKKVNWDE